MAKLKGTHHVITASFTDSGAPAYLTANGGWSPVFQDAHATPDQLESQKLLDAAIEQERQVCDPYCIMVNDRNGSKEPLSQREAIRAQGPTTPLRRPDA